jgi:hypothetical protein
LTKSAPNRELVSLLKRADKDALLAALEEADRENLARLVSATWQWIDDDDPLPALKNAHERLKKWAGRDKDKLQFSEEVADVIRRFLALREGL